MSIIGFVDASVVAIAERLKDKRFPHDRQPTFRGDQAVALQGIHLVSVGQSRKTC